MCSLERMREGACALQGQCPHERHSCHVEKHCVKISHKLREIFHSGMFERSRSGYCDLKGFQVDLSAHYFSGRLMSQDLRIVRPPGKFWEKTYYFAFDLLFSTF